MKKKILFVSSSIAGGAERMTVLYSKILNKKGYDCSFLLTVFPGNPLLILDFIPKSIKTKILKLHYEFFIPLQFLLHIILNRTNIIFCSQPGNSVRILKLRKFHLLKPKFVYREYLMPSDQLKGIEYRAKYLQLADLLIAQTSEMRDEMIKYYHVSPAKVVVVNNPIDIDLINDKIKESFPFDHSYTNYVAINRVVPQKDMMTMLRAFEIVLKEKTHSRLYICGDTSDKSYYHELEDFVRNHNMKEFVFFEGPQNNPFKYLKNADVFCLSSVYEGLPNGMLEAMYLGIPIAVTRSIPYISQVVVEGKHGFLSEVANAIDFSNAMLKASSLNITEKFVDVNKSEEKICDLIQSL